MAQLRQEYAQLSANDAVVVVVGPESREAFEWYWQKEHFAFVGLSDPQETVSRLFSDGPAGGQWPVRTPEWVLIDKEGHVRHREFASWAGEPRGDGLIEMLGALNRG